MSEQREDDIGMSATPESGRPDPPAANQAKDEPIETAPDTSAQASDGSSERAGPVDGVKTTAAAPPGKPDGEVDTRA